MHYQERTDPFLRPNEVAAREEELHRIKTLINDAPYIRSQVANMGAMIKRRNAIAQDLKDNTPPPYAGPELDRAHAREQTLRAQFIPDMPTQREMRRCPPGAPDKHMAFERKHKQAILEWKNIRRRQQASGLFGAEDINCANIELYRKNGSRSELPMDNALVKGKQIHLPPRIAVTNVMSEEERGELDLERLRWKIQNGDSQAIESLKALLAMVPDSESPPGESQPRSAAGQKYRRQGAAAERLAARERTRALRAGRAAQTEAEVNSG